MYLLILLLSLCGSGFSSLDKKPQNCLSYESTTIILRGEISRKIFAGRPNFESIKKGDEPERYWILHLAKPICVNGTKDTPDDEPEKNVSDVQLILSESQYTRYKDLLNKQVIISGKLLHAISGHHHTKVLIEVVEMKVNRRNRSETSIT